TFASALRLEALSRAQLEALRLIGGLPLLVRGAAMYTLPASFSAAVLGGILTVNDPGPGQIMGYHGVASDILIAFSARNDIALAAVKALALGVVLLPITLAV